MQTNESSESSEQNLQAQVSNEMTEDLLTDDQQPQPYDAIKPKFPVVYNDNTYMVDMESLQNASPKFRELIQPYIQSGDQLINLHLTVLDKNFTSRNMNNFFNLVQNLPADVQNSEMEEVCQIAKLFDDEQLYNTGVTFIRNNIDPNFSVPDNMYDGSDGKKHLIIEGPTQLILHGDDSTPMRISDDDETTTTTFNTTENQEQNQQQNQEQNQQQNQEQNQEQNGQNDNQSDGEHKPKSMVYTVIVEHPFLSLTQYKFEQAGQIIFAAKKQDNNVYIAEGSYIHINSQVKKHIAHIYLDTDKTNKIFLKDQQVMLKFVNSGRPNHLSIAIDFKNNGKDVSWTPRKPKYDAINDKYYLSFHGEYHHVPLISKKNIVLENKKGNPTFIVRKMDTDHYEIECSHLLDPLNAFVIGLSDIIGPYNDPCGDIEV